MQYQKDVNSKDFPMLAQTAELYQVHQVDDHLLFSSNILALSLKHLLIEFNKSSKYYQKLQYSQVN